MGIIISSALKRLFGKKQLRIIMVGLDSAGKTTVLYRLKLGHVITTIPTIGFNIETVEYKNISFTVWDVGGQDMMRRLWRHYFQNTHGIIFVVDSGDSGRLDEATAVLENLLHEPELCGSVLLIFANKQDITGAMKLAELSDKMHLYNVHNRPWHIQASCAISGTGLREGLDWLSKELAGK